MKSLMVVITGIIMLSGSMFFLKAKKHMKIDKSISDESERNPASKEIKANFKIPIV